MIDALKYKKIINKYSILAVLIFLAITIPSAKAFAYQCGEDLPNQQAITTSIDLGCRQQGTPIADLSFAIIRFLSAGVGIVIVGSTVFAGIMYTTSRDNPESSKKAQQRLVSNVIALVLFIFSYAILNFLIPGGLFN